MWNYSWIVILVILTRQEFFVVIVVENSFLSMFEISKKKTRKQNIQAENENENKNDTDTFFILVLVFFSHFAFRMHGIRHSFKNIYFCINFCFSLVFELMRQSCFVLLSQSTTTMCNGPRFVFFVFFSRLYIYLQLINWSQRLVIYNIQFRLFINKIKRAYTQKSFL